MQNSPPLFSFSGFVKQDKGRGKTLGYPTANLSVEPKTQEGIFVGTVLYDGTAFPALVFIGASLTFNEHDKKAEIYLLDFEEDLYGKNLKVSVFKKFRDNKKFASKDALVAQMQQDEKQAREYFKRDYPSYEG